MNLSYLLVAVLVVVGCQPNEARLGFDGIVSMSGSTFTCLEAAGYDFFIARVYRSLGLVDTNGLNNVITARKANWTDVGGYLFPCLEGSRPVCGDGGAQVQAAVEALNAAGAQIDRLWLDVEVFDWFSDKQKNRAFIEDMVDKANDLNFPVGIYSSENSWNQIVGSDYEKLKGYPLWWARWNGPSFDNFNGFGGWSTPTVKQFEGDKTLCGIGLDKNYKP